MLLSAGNKEGKGQTLITLTECFSRCFPSLQILTQQVYPFCTLRALWRDFIFAKAQEQYWRRHKPCKAELRLHWCPCGQPAHLTTAEWTLSLPVLPLDPWEDLRGTKISVCKPGRGPWTWSRELPPTGVQLQTVRKQITAGNTVYRALLA